MRRLSWLGIALLAALPAQAQQSSAPSGDKPADNMDIVLEKAKADKKFLVADNMNLTESEAKAFWPVYESYQKDLAAINDRLGKTISAFSDASQKGTANVSDEAARSEEHTSELQSRPHLVCRLLLEKKKKDKFSILLKKKKKIRK